MARTIPLVSQYVEKISREMLTDYHDIIGEYTKDRHGVYALYCNDKLYYVGLASNLKSRLKKHLSNVHGKKWDTFSLYITINLNAMKELESLLLRVFRPIGNSTGGRFVKAENLERRLKRDVNDRMREKAHALLPGRKRNIKAKVEKVYDESIPLASIVCERKALRARYKGQVYKALLRRDGRIRYNDVNYDTPSAAAGVIRGGKVNGWSFWRYERSPGDWVPLAKMRK